MLVAFLAGLTPSAQAGHTPFVYPHGGYVTTPYHTYRSSCTCYHDALDISDDGTWGDPIVAAARGTVSYRCAGWCGGYGNYLIINHEGGYQTLYAHLQDFAVVEGQTVSQGQVVGHEGSTGNSSGPHLHFEIRRNGVKQYIPGGSWQWVSRGAAIPYHYDLLYPPPSDTTPPSTSASLSGTQGDAGWWRSAVTVRLSAGDSQSGISATRARIDGGGWFAYGGPFAVGGEGGHRVEFYSVDGAGNQEGTRAVSFSIDSAPPVTSTSVGAPRYQGAALFVSSATPFTLSASDATSGVRATFGKWRAGAAVAGTTFFLGGADGPGTFSAESVDRAGNVEAWRARAVVLDNTPPVVNLSSLPEGSVVVSLEPVLVRADAEDALAGVARVEFLVDGALRASVTAAPFEWSWPAGDEWAGEHVVEARAVDRLGHAAVSARKVLTVPTTPAGAAATAEHARATADGLANDPPTAGAVVEYDEGAGVYRVGVLLDGEFVGAEVPEPGTP